MITCTIGKDDKKYYFKDGKRISEKIASSSKNVAPCISKGSAKKVVKASPKKIIKKASPKKIIKALSPKKVVKKVSPKKVKFANDEEVYIIKVGVREIPIERQIIFPNKLIVIVDKKDLKPQSIYKKYNLEKGSLFKANKQTYEALEEIWETSLGWDEEQWNIWLSSLFYQNILNNLKVL